MSHALRLVTYLLTPPRIVSVAQFETIAKMAADVECVVRGASPGKY
jgi:hypothetical protein